MTKLGKFLLILTILGILVSCSEEVKLKQPPPTTTTSSTTTTTTTTLPPTTTTLPPTTRRQVATTRAARAAPAKPTGDIWWALAGCETGGKYDNPNTGNGYYGYFQFSLSTWRSIGGTGYPHEHSYETQRSFAQKLQARSGWGQWPHCSRKLGLR